jgi:4-hydroxybenzoate polyprenyltransferase
MPEQKSFQRNLDKKSILKPNYFVLLLCITIFGWVLFSLTASIFKISLLQITIIQSFHCLVYCFLALIYILTKNKLENVGLFFIGMFIIKFFFIGIFFISTRKLFPSSNHNPYFLFLFSYFVFLFFDISYKVKQMRNN